MTLSELYSGEACRKMLQRRWLVWLVNALLLAWLLLLVGSAIRDLLEPPVAANVETPPEIAPATARPQIPASQIAAWHLFGTPSSDEAMATQQTITAPETTLKLTLRGIYATEVTQVGHAIIQKPDKQEKHFKIKDSIFGLATLEEIYSDRVIILRNGRYETLTLPKESLDLGQRVPDATRKKRGKLIDDYRKAILSGDIEKFVGVVDIEDVYNDDGFYGFQLQAESERGKHLLSELGLEDKDVVIEIDGKILGEDPEAVRNIGKLKTATELSIVVDRNGTKIPYHIKMPQVQ